MNAKKPVAGKNGERYVPYAERKGNESIVYFTRDLSPKGLIKLYEKVNGNIVGNVGSKSIPANNMVPISFLGLG